MLPTSPAASNLGFAVQDAELSQLAARGIRFVRMRRSFNVSPGQANRLAVLRWNRIDYGATAYINGRKVGSNEPTGPYFVLLKPAALRSGTNHIVLKIPGAAGARRSRSGQFLFPAGLISGPQRPRLSAAISCAQGRTTIPWASKS